MIPRLKPNFGLNELAAIFKCGNVKVEDFETAFARKFDSKYALAFPYGRTGLYCLFKALGFNNDEIVIPAYTCVVVAHAVVLSGNIPKFVDITLEDFNMNLDLVDQAINKNTKAIVATHLFGYPLNVDKLKDIVTKHEKHFGHKIYIINDCAHSFGAKYNEKLVCNQGDAAVFALNISKLISSIFGGMVTTNNDEVYKRLVEVRSELCYKSSGIKDFKRALYFLTTYPTFQQNVYGLINYIEENTRLIDKFTKYYDEGKIDFPTDWQEMIGKIEAVIGLEQLKKYDEIVKARIKNTFFYNENLTNFKNLKLPPIIEGATYSHYVPVTDNPSALIDYMKRKNVQLGNLIEYSIPHMSAYKKFKESEYLVSRTFSTKTINLPVYDGVNVGKVSNLIRQYFV